MSTHTPGPWEVESDGETLWVTPFNRLTPVICDMIEREGETEANARLIASAPDLLAACKALVDLLNDELDPEQCRAWDAAVAAIARAEGKGQAA